MSKLATSVYVSLPLVHLRCCFGIFSVEMELLQGKEGVLCLVVCEEAASRYSVHLFETVCVLHVSALDMMIHRET